MGTAAGVGYSVQKHSEHAGREAAQRALEQLGGGKPDISFVFATAGYDHDLLIHTIRETLVGTPLCGCSGEGIITQEMVAETNFGVAVMVVRSDNLRFATACVKGSGQGPPDGADLASKLAPLCSPDDLACFLFADGLVFDFDPFLDELMKALPCRLPLFGGLAADNWASKKTYQYHNDEVFSEGVSCVLMSGKGKVAWGISHGCVPIGTQRTITRSKGNVIYEIDGIPALDVLKEYCEEDWKRRWNKLSLSLCLGFRTPEHMKKEYGDYLIRYVVSKDDRDGSITIQSDVQEGTELWIVRRDKELIRRGLMAIGRDIRQGAGDGKPSFVLHFECMGRGRVIFREQERMDLIRTLQEEVGTNLPWIGFYTYGEIGPVGNYNCFHNFTAVVVAVYL